MKSTSRHVCLITALLLPFGCATEPEVAIEVETEPSIEGVWTHEEWEVIGGPTAGVGSDLQPSLVFITKNYFSTMFVSGAEPRPLFSSATPSEAEIVGACSSFVAAAGPYELEGSTMVIRPSVGIDPNLMTGGSFQLDYQLEGDTLWLIYDPSKAITPGIEPAPSEITEERLKLRRLE